MNGRHSPAAGASRIPAAFLVVLFLSAGSLPVQRGIAATLHVATKPAAGVTDLAIAAQSGGAEAKQSIPSLLARYRETMRKEPRHPEAYVLAADLYPRPESEVLFRKAIEAAPDYAPAHLGLARYLAREGQAAAAFAAYQRARTLMPGDRKALLETVNAAVKASRLEDAKAMAGADPELRAELIQSLMDRGDLRGAERSIAEYGFDRSEDGTASALRGRLAVMNGRRDEGLKLLLESWKKSPEWISHYRWVYPRESLVQALAKAGLRAEAGAVARKGIELHPREYPLYEAAWKTLFAEVKADYSAERKSVEAEIEKLLATHPADPELYKIAALGYTMASRPAEAERLNRRLIAEFPYSQAAMWQKRTVAVREQDLPRKAALIAEINRDFPNMPMYSEYIKTLEEMKVPDAKLLEAVEEYFNTVPYKYLPIYEAGPIFLSRRVHLDRLADWMRQIEKPAGAPIDSWDIRIGALKGKLLLLQGKTEEAEATLRGFMGREAQGLSNVDKGNLKYRLAEVLEEQKRLDEALDMYAQGYAESQHYLAEAGERFRALYRRVKGSDAGMDDFLSIREGMHQVAANIGIERGTRMNRPAPDFSLLSLAGERVSLAALRGKVVVLNFWATWCGPCIKELPHFQEFYVRNKDRSGVAVLAVTTDENRALVEPFISKHKYTFTVLFDEGLRPKYEVRGIPTTYIIDRSGNLRLRMVGFNTNEELVPYLEKLVAEFTQ